MKNTKKIRLLTKADFLFGAGERTRTFDLLITNQLHYRLCYTSNNALVLYLVFPDLSRVFLKIYKIFSIPSSSGLIFSVSYGTIV